MLTCRREILDSLPKPNGDKPVHIFLRAVSFLLPQLQRDITESERVWTSNFNTRLRQSLFSRLPGTLRKIGINASRSGLRCTLETLAKGCHKLWVTRHATKKVDLSQGSAPADESDGDSAATILSLVDEEDGEEEQGRTNTRR